ncbi:MAG: pantoate--beta-alanine ligase [Longimicrobiales bacterium]
MKRLEHVADLRAELAAARAQRARIALVPTMGYLHEGHLTLVDRARAAADCVVVSVFVNPLQFGPDEDFERYPRNLVRDAGLLERRGVDVMFAPEQSELYPSGDPLVRVSPGVLAERLCGAYRPGHFEGMLTVVAKLFNLVQPDTAVFGQKDFQQTVLVRRMVRDLDMPVAIDVAPIIREEDGLAMSSRNAYLDFDQRTRAVSLHRGLQRARDAFRAGERDPVRLRGMVRREIAGGIEPQYIEIVDPETLEPVRMARSGNVVALAAHIGRTRLIDNIVLD